MEDKRKPRFDDNFTPIQKAFGEYYLGIPFLIGCVYLAYYLLK